MPGGTPPRRTQGAALVVGLVLLLALTILGVAAVGTAALEIAIAGNAQFQHDAFELAENAVDTVIAEGRYARDEPRVLAPRGTPGADREAVATFVGATPVTDRAFSVGTVEALHFEVVAEGRGPRNAAVTVAQGFYVIATKD
jgi:type IV pilus assembly protein PilX